MELTVWQTITGLLQIRGAEFGEKTGTSELSSDSVALKTLYMHAHLS